MSTMQERRRYMRGIWALDGMLDDPASMSMSKEGLMALIGTSTDRLYETEIRKACRVLGRFITRTWDPDCYPVAMAHLDALLSMDSEPGSDEREEKPKPKKWSRGNALAKVPDVTSPWGD